MSWSLNEILADRDASAAFRAYLQARHADENFDFLKAVANYRRAPSKAAAHRIFNRYVSDTAARQANISAAGRTAIQDGLPQRFRPWRPRPPADLFDAAAKDVASPTADYIPAFVLTPAGAPYAVALDDLAGGLAGADVAAGGGEDIAPPPEAPEAPPDVAPQPDRPDNPREDDRGNNRDRDENKSNNREAVAEK